MTFRDPTFASGDLEPVVPFLSPSPQSAPDSTRRHSLPSPSAPYLRSSIWSTNLPHASLQETGEAARGEHMLDGATITHRISALRQLNGATATKTNPRYAKSTGARNSTFSQPVIVRTYSGSRPASRTREKVEVKKDVRPGKVELPPLEAFTFKGIMDSIHSSVAEDLERIAEICARSRYSLSNQYEVHMPPHGIGREYVVHHQRSQVVPGGGPTLQAIESDDEQMRPPRRRGARRVRSIAQGTLETIMSSSRSSDEDKAKKESAATLAEAVRGRAAKKAAFVAAKEAIDTGDDNGAASRPKSRRSRSATFASAIIDNAQGLKVTGSDQGPTALLSSPARPQTSANIELESASLLESSVLSTTPVQLPTITSKPSLVRHDSRASTLRPDVTTNPSVFESISSWLPWSKSGGFGRNTSYAEGSLRELLRTKGGLEEIDRKGKAVDRGPL